MKIDQISIFNFVEHDEIKDTLKLLEIGQEIKLLGYEIRLTDCGYEIENKDEEKKMYFKTSIYKQTRLEKYTEFGIYNFLSSKRPNSSVKLDTWDLKIKKTAHDVVDEILSRINIIENSI